VGRFVCGVLCGFEILGVLRWFGGLVVCSCSLFGGGGGVCMYVTTTMSRWDFELRYLIEIHTCLVSCPEFSSVGKLGLPTELAEHAHLVYTRGFRYQSILCPRNLLASWQATRNFGSQKLFNFLRQIWDAFPPTTHGSGNNKRDLELIEGSTIHITLLARSECSVPAPRAMQARSRCALHDQ
jgi:hypothetical protein